MTLDELKETWQSGDVRGDALSDEDLLRLVQEKAESFDESVRRRDRRETVAAAIVFLFFALMLLDPSWIVRAGALLIMGSSVFIYWTLRRARSGYSLPDSDQPVAHAICNEREKVEEQIELLESVLWWYIAPLAVGIVLVVVGDAGLSWFTIGYTASVAALGGGIYYLNQRTVRRRLRPRHEKLTRLLDQVENRGQG